jgi:phosphoenolpyruvate synthase/pyruvate phosphate dikinase
VLPAERFWAALEACGGRDRAEYLQRSALRLDPRHTLDIAASLAESMASPAVEELARLDAAAAFALLGLRRVVCRSSSVMEDGRSAAFPGIFLSVLNIGSPAALATAIARCWRSVFSPGAVRYLLRMRTEPVDFSLALLLQRQVAADWYGLYVSADPVTGAGDPLADLSSAAPEALAEGGEVVLRAHRRQGRWTGIQGEPSVSASLEKVRVAAERLARHLGTDVDLEFALPAQGDPVVLQCRPLTRVAPRTPSGPSAAPAGDLLHGRPCAAGRAVGVAGAESGIVVVDRLTTTDYEVVFHAAGVVMEQDASPLSHVAILCRELGVPFVCGVPEARALLLGRRVAVDGRSGQIELLQDDAAGFSVSGEEGRRERSRTASITTVELVLRLLAEGRPGHPPAAEAERVARRYAQALGADRIRLVRHPVDPAELRSLERLGSDLFGPAFSVGSIVSEVEAGVTAGHSTPRVHCGPMGGEGDDRAVVE